MSANQPTGFSYLNKKYPRLSSVFARLPLGDFPTPLHRLDPGSDKFWIKRDEKTHALYGGNKLRKLEYLLAHARQRGATHIATFGGIGSNHALATARHARALGLECSCLLLNQAMTDSLTATLMQHQLNDTRLINYSCAKREQRTILRTLRDEDPHRLHVVPMGGTCARGSLGYVNAALELASQWPREAARPERIYLPIGTMGTVAGLAVGFTLAGWSTKIVAVRVVHPSICNQYLLEKLVTKIGDMLQRADPRLRLNKNPALSVQLREEYLGRDYADVTPASENAVQAVAERWGLALETTYSGKAMACLLDDAKTQTQHPPWLFWNTYNGPLPAASESELSPATRVFLPSR